MVVSRLLRVLDGVCRVCVLWWYLIWLVVLGLCVCVLVIGFASDLCGVWSVYCY